MEANGRLETSSRPLPRDTIDLDSISGQVIHWLYTMRSTLPSSSPSPALRLRALPVLISHLNDPSIYSSPSLVVQTLQQTLQILSFSQLHSPTHISSPLLTSTTPLSALLHLSTLSPSTIPLPLLIEAIIAYPHHTSTISKILSYTLDSQPNLLDTIRTEVIPALVTRLRLSPSRQVVRMLHLLLRSHEEILGLLLIEADYILPALRDSYARIDGIRGKSDALLVCHVLIKAVHGGQSGEALKRLMGAVGTASKNKVLVDAGLREDYEAFFEEGEIGKGEIAVLKRIRDEDAASDLVGLYLDFERTSL